MRTALLSVVAIAGVACSNADTTCRWPSTIASATDAAMPGCVASVSPQSCRPSEYWLVCHGGTPDPSLHCRDLILPGVAEYCCPCVK